MHGYLYLTLQLLRGRPVGPFIRRLQAWERLDRPAFQRLVSGRLEDTLRYARERVPLYSSGPWREAFAHADPTDIHSWPVLERRMLKTHAADLLARAVIPGLFYRQSSASTGEPVRVALNPHAAGWSWANEYRAMLWHGIRPGIKTLMLWGHNNPVLDWVRNRKTFLTTNFTPALLEEVGRTLLQQRPTLCWGHPSAVAQLARYMRASYPAAPRPLVPYAKVGGEQLFPFEREEIEQALGARVIESYGCTEVGAIAAECPAGSLHVFAEHVHVEIFRDEEPAAPGEFGDIVATSLTNRAMPLVRCRIGDRGRLSLEPCPCGLPHPVLRNLEGRATDFFLAADGGRVHGSVLAHSLKPVLTGALWDALHQVLFQQMDQHSWQVFVESGNGFHETHAAQLSAIVRQVFGENTRVEVRRVPVIPRERSGKFRYYRLTRDQGAAKQPDGQVAGNEAAASKE
ncbi:MAG: hypothetical protein AB1671_13045 [Thermodesulfobacteriota bacterium]